MYAPQLGDALPEYGSVAKEMSLWLQMQFVRGFESGGTSAAVPRHCYLQVWGDCVSKGLRLGPGSEP